MSIMLVETYVVKAERQDGFEPLLKEFLEYKKNHPELFKGVLSWKLYRQKYGPIGGMYVELWEYENTTAMEEVNQRIFEDAVMKRINSDFHQLVDPATFSSWVWNSVA